MNRSHKYVSLFSGAGGLDIGLERAGLSPISLSELEPVYCETLRENRSFVHEDGLRYFAEAEIQNADIRDLAARDVSLGQDVDLIVGGPPCQSFSSSGKQHSLLDPRGMLVMEFCRLLDEIRPRMFLFENVRGLVTARDSNGEPGGVIAALLQEFKDLGYSCRAGLMNAADYGSHQRRVRCFILGSRSGEAPQFPVATHSRNPDFFHRPWQSLGDFLSLHEDEDKDAFVFPSKELALKLSGLPDGKGLKSPGRKEPTRPSGHWGYRQGTFIADQTLPARTVTASSSQDWVRRQGVLRRLTLNEVKLLQGFPSDWVVRGTKSQRFKQIGNAVPSVFGELLGAMLVSFLNDFPDSPAVPLEMPDSFANYIGYTKKDHARNESARSVHRLFD